MTQRMEKVQKLAREVLGDLIHGLKDPRVGFVTVTKVRITQDLRHAKVLVSVLGEEEERASTMKGLKSATPYLRVELGHQIRLKYLPELVFELDTGADEAARIESVLRQIHERDEHEEGVDE